MGINRVKAILILLGLGIVCACALYVKIQSNKPSDINRWLQKKVEPQMVTYDAPIPKYSRIFADMQDVHIEAARKFGLESAPETRQSVEDMKRSLVRIEENKYYTISDLSHSVPYLRPNAAKELMTIGKQFQEALKEKGLPKYRIIVTSVLRTEEDVKNLRKSNTNASKDSAHRYGTTFDIWYADYDRISYKSKMDQSDLRKVLAEVLQKEQEAGRIYVKYEASQHCFHITTRF